MGALLKPVKSGIVEMSGLHDTSSSLTESIHDMGDVLGNAAELSIDPTDLSKHSANPVLTFKDYEVFSEKVGIFRRNLYKFGDIFGDSSETFGDGSDQPSLLESRGQEVIQRP